MDRGVLKGRGFFFLKDRPEGPPLEAFLPWPNVGHVYPPFLGIAEKAGVT